MPKRFDGNEWLAVTLSDLKAGQLELHRRVSTLERAGVQWKLLLPYFYGAVGLGVGFAVAVGKLDPHVVATIAKSLKH